MAVAGLTLPKLSEADPEVAGEGTLDPLGLAPVADRLAEQLVPGVRARMRRIRFVTASAVGALASLPLFELPPGDGASSPSVCFEWLVLEAFARRNKDGGVLDESGIPGSAKARSTILVGDGHLTASNYLKQPGVFGFTGVYMPLSRSLRVLDDQRRPAERLTELVAAWEADQGFEGFVGNVQGSAGSSLRGRLTQQIREALQTGRSPGKNGIALWSEIERSLRPSGAGPREKALLRAWLASPEQPVRAEMAGLVAHEAPPADYDLLHAVLIRVPSADARRRLDAIIAFERWAWLLMGTFNHLRVESSKLGLTPMAPSLFAADDTLEALAGQLPGAFTQACERIGDLDTELLMLFATRFGELGVAQSRTQFVESMLSHHQQTQARKPPHGKRAWFEQSAGGWTVRPMYRLGPESAVDPSIDGFVHPYRLVALRQFMEDLKP